MKEHATVGIFGGSFNPPHLAHVLAASWVLATQPLDHILVVPTYQHPFMKPLAPYADRLNMCTAAMEHLPAVQVSSIERDLKESRTLPILEHLQTLHPNWTLRLIIGADILLESHEWFGFDQIRALAPPIVLGRARTTLPQPTPTLLPDLSSTEIRSKIAAKKWEDLKNLVPRAVLHYIQTHQLYL